MNFYYDNTVYDFFDLSIIMPFYNKPGGFTQTLPVNLHFFQRNGIELIIVPDAPGEEHELICLLNRYPFLNYKVIINKASSEWSNPAKTLNAGIHHASRKYILVINPEIELLTDVIYQLRYMLAYHPNTYAIAQIVFADMDAVVSIDQIHRYELMPCGSIMVEKRFLQEINGYAEKFTSRADLEDNLRARLDLLGIQKILVSQAIGIHRRKNPALHQPGYIAKNNTTKAEMPVEMYSAIYFPKQIRENDDNRGTSFSAVAYSSETRPCKKNQCEAYLNSFEEYWIKNESIFQKQYRLIALIQVRNEIQHLPEVLYHLDQYCDAIILLDDGSTDGSYETAMSEKLVIKAKKLPEALFDDLKLRNITLDLAAFINAEWLFFFDADERFHEKYADLNSIANRQDVDSVSFSVIHLWNDESCYKVNLPESANGILPRLRMFRCYGHLQIVANRMLHFPATPFQQKKYKAPVLIKHYGNIDPATRKMKYERYTMQDKEGLTQGYTYDYLIEDHADLKPVASLSVDIFSKR